MSYKIDIETAYENGDTDFGGNNLTYRILQILKIELARTFREPPLKSLRELLKAFDVDVYRFVDEHGTGPLYKELQEEYRKAEEVIPTRFKDYEKLSRADYYRVMETVKEYPMVACSVYDVNTLIKADIYGIVQMFMERMYEKDELYGYSIIKLTGQSCKLYLKDAEEQVRYSFTYSCAPGEFTPTSHEEIQKSYEGKIPQDEVDCIVDREAKFFVWARPMDWGIWWCPSSAMGKRSALAAISSSALRTTRG